MDKKQIAVFGATGKVGSELIRFLSQAGIHTVAITRDKSRATEMAFVEWIEVDMLDKPLLLKTLKATRAIFLASSIWDRYVEAQNNVIEVSKELGVEHIVKLSSPNASKDATSYIAKQNWEVEELLRQSGVNWSILHPHPFMQNWLGELAETVRKERKIYEATGDGKRSFIDTRDIAEVAFRILTEPEKHRAKTYLLTGNEAVNYGQLAEAITHSINEKVTFQSLTADEAKIRMEKNAVPPLMIDMLLKLAEDQKKGKTTFVNDAVTKIVNKPARSIYDFANHYANRFK